MNSKMSSGSASTSIATLFEAAAITDAIVHCRPTR